MVGSRSRRNARYSRGRWLCDSRCTRSIGLPRNYELDPLDRRLGLDDGYERSSNRSTLERSARSRSLCQAFDESRTPRGRARSRSAAFGGAHALTETPPLSKAEALRV